MVGFAFVSTDRPDWSHNNFVNGFKCSPGRKAAAIVAPTHRPICSDSQHLCAWRTIPCAPRYCIHWQELLRPESSPYLEARYYQASDTRQNSQDENHWKSIQRCKLPHHMCRRSKPLAQILLFDQGRPTKPKLDTGVEVCDNKVKKNQRYTTNEKPNVFRHV